MQRPFPPISSRTRPKNVREKTSLGKENTKKPTLGKEVGKNFPREGIRIFLPYGSFFSGEINFLNFFFFSFWPRPFLTSEAILKHSLRLGIPSKVKERLLPVKAMQNFLHFGDFFFLLFFFWQVSKFQF